MKTALGAVLMTEKEATWINPPAVGQVKYVCPKAFKKGVSSAKYKVQSAETTRTGRKLEGPEIGKSEALA
ncbi:hypothetical protein AEP_00681 [Curvibacter sp. AEP1-3]|uniref:hypothetical protein n=1 Tax=Curvibacter sp. AEP1-3 TaxID=1844971 RepID=UPI000B3C2F8A|nr:hypothetical protein [Curvibacter sp. AEP1-3]ARV17641.1 hypothetical protein AEP_00681 [Curvibacter sp. AEP1-3]